MPGMIGVREPPGAERTRRVTAPRQGRPSWRRGRSSLARRQRRTALFFLLPWLTGVVVLQAYPLLMTVYYAFTNFNGINFPPRFVGLQNFIRAFSFSGVFWISVVNTLWWVGVSVPATVVLGFALAVLLNRRWSGIGLVRALVYLPSMVPSVGAGILFAWIFNPTSGPVDAVLRLMSLHAPGWFVSPQWAKPGLLLLSLWQVGPTMIIFLAGLQSLPTDVTEAAVVDGAGYWRRLRSVVIPLLTPTIFFNLVLGLIGAFSLFTQALAVSVAAGSTGAQQGAQLLGNPSNSLLFYTVNMYRVTFQNFSFGYGSALSLLLTIVVAGVAAILFASARRWVFYAGGQGK